MKTQKGNQLVTDKVTALQNENKFLNDQIATLREEKKLLSEQVAILFQSEQQRISKGREVDEQDRFSRSFSELGKKINADSKKEDILKATTKFILYEINFERCLIFLREEKNDSFSIHAMDGYYDDELSQRMSSLSLSKNDPALSSLYSAAETEFILCDEDCQQQDVLQLRSMFELYEYVVFPMQHIGFLVAGNSKERRKYQARIPSESKASKSEALLRMKNLVNQTTIALNNAVLKDNLYKKISVLNKVGQKLTSSIQINLPAILELIYEQAGIVMDVSNMFITLYDKKTQTLEFPLVSLKGQRLKKEDLPKARQLDKTEDGLTEQVIRHKKSFRIDKVSEWSQKNNVKLPQDPPPKSWLGVPMILEGKLFGIIALFDFNRESAYNVNDREVLETMAGQAAVAIENVRSYESVEEKLKKQNQELKKRNKQLKKAQEDILEKENLLSSALVAQDITHRLNNSLGSLGINIKKIRKDIASALTNKDVRLLQEANDSIIPDIYDVIKSLAGELRLVSNPQPQELSVKKIVDKILQQVTIKNKFSPDNVSIHRKYCESTPSVITPYRNLNNCLHEIIGNAGTAISDKIKKSCHNEKLHLTVAIEENNGFVSIDIIDNGMPIPIDIIDDIFTRGVTSKKETDSGYGLWRAKILAQSMGGTLELLDSGSEKRFCLSIPMSSKMPSDDTEPLPLAFIIDDERSWRNIISRWLKEEGFALKTADNMESALKLFNNARKPPHLVVLDVSLSLSDGGNVDGLSLIDKARELGDTKIIILTGYKENTTSYEENVDLLIEKVRDGEFLSQTQFSNYLKELKVS